MENIMKFEPRDKLICILGLGYVGLPLACAFADKNYKVIGFDLNKERIDALKLNNDWTEEISAERLKALQGNLIFTDNELKLADADIVIVAVPTPIKIDNTPDLQPLILASETIGRNIKSGSTIVYESTVFPGATEEVCIPIIESISGLEFNNDFFVGYSPERINPGDKVNKLESISKIVSGSTDATLELLEELYGSIISAEIHSAPSIKVAEAAKIMENIQRDVNIALVNELHQIFSVMKINTLDVVNAASTKWNFMYVEPGLVGGHCIGVDPHYMIYKSSGLGHIPNLMRNAREINEGMSTWVINNFLQYCQLNRINLIESTVTVMGYTFKKNCPDTRNSKVENIIKSLKDLGIKTYIWDPCLDIIERNKLEKVGLKVHASPPNEIQVGMLCVKHDLIINHIKLSSANIFDFTKIN
jgi:UDP-N-acetyl-D-galactosamine dehydrogenase